jgi:hypothetical protein
MAAPEPGQSLRELEIDGFAAVAADHDSELELGHRDVTFCS